jgi:hypothetical protein
MTSRGQSLERVTNVLVCGQSFGGDAEAYCLDHLAESADTTSEVIWISYSKAATACVETWQDQVGTLPRHFDVVLASDRSWSLDDEPDEESVAVRSVSGPGDLTNVGVAINEALADKAAPRLYFDSLSALLQYVPLESAYEFCNAVTTQCHHGPVRKAVFRLDPTAHDQQTVDALTSLFDARVTLQEDDTVTIRTRYADSN